MEIIKKEENGIEFYTVDLTGQSGMSQSGLAILAGVSQQALSVLEKTLTNKAPSESLSSFVDKPLTLTIENVTVNGKDPGNLTIYKASYCAAVLKHYASEPRSNPVAINSSLKFMEMGINGWIQVITGWNERVKTLKPHTNVYIERLSNMSDHKIADNLWMVFREASELLLLVEKDWQVPINDYDLMDGSIGKCWKEYREGKPWAKVIQRYEHQFRDTRGKRPANAFHVDEWQYFKAWLREEYVPKHLPAYLVYKYGRHAVRQIYSENGCLTDQILEITEIKRPTPKANRQYQDFLLAREQLLGRLQGD
jgi:DNA-binding XRE family transcriptional regulator